MPLVWLYARDQNTRLNSQIPNRYLPLYPQGFVNYKLWKSTSTSRYQLYLRVLKVGKKADIFHSISTNQVQDPGHVELFIDDHMNAICLRNFKIQCQRCIESLGNVVLWIRIGNGRMIFSIARDNDMDRSWSCYIRVSESDVFGIGSSPGPITDKL